MINFVVQDDGIVRRAEPQEAIQLKEASNVKLSFTFYKDVNHTETWDLTGATVAFSAVMSRGSVLGSITKTNASTDWDKASADDGVLGLILNSTDLSEARSLVAEIQFQPALSQRVYKTDDFVINITKDAN